MEKNKLGLTATGRLKNAYLNVPEMPVLIAMVALIIIATLMNPVFINPRNLAALSTAIMLYGLLTLGETFIIMVGEIDISIGSMTNFAYMFLGYQIVFNGMHWIPATLLTICLTVALSLFNAFLIVKFKLPAFIITIAMLYICRGAARIITYSKPITVSEDNKVNGLYTISRSSELIGGFQWGFILFVILVILAHVVLKKTAYGRKIIAVGDNPRVAKLSGINSDLVKISTFAISGVMVGLTAMFMLANLPVANVGPGDGWEMYVIAACAIGGISLVGGSGSALGSMFGVLFVTSLINVFNMVAIKSNMQNLFFGSIIVVAVLLDRKRRNIIFGRQQ